MRWGRLGQAVVFVLCVGGLASPPHGGWYIVLDGMIALLGLLYGRAIVRWLDADALGEQREPLPKEAAKAVSPGLPRGE